MTELRCDEQLSEIHEPGMGLDILIISAMMLSSISALIYEIAWHRVAMRFLGSDIWASSAVIGFFMAGLGLGAVLWLYFRSRARNILFTYALVELFISICGIISVHICHSGTLQKIDDFMCLPFGEGAILAKFCIIGLLIITPSALIGTTFPILADYTASNKSKEKVLILYATSCSGAIIGCLLCGIVLLPALGISGTLYAAAALNLFIASVFLAISFATARISKLTSKRIQDDGSKSISSEIPQQASFGKEVQKICFTSVIFSSSSIIFLQVLWTRFFVLCAGSSTYAITAVLASCLLGLTLGAWLATLFVSTIRKKVLVDKEQISILLALLLGFSILCAVALASQLYQYQLIPTLMSTLVDFTRIQLQMPESTSIFGLEFSVADWTARLLVIGSLLLFPTFTIGLIFPLSLAIVSKEIQNGQLSPAPRIYSFSMLGCVLGAISACIIFEIGELYPESQQSIIEFGTISCCMIYVCLSIFIAGKCFKRLQRSGILPEIRFTFRIFAISLIILISLSIFSRPRWNKELLSGGMAFIEEIGAVESSDEVVYYKEGSNSTVSVTKNTTSNLLSLRNNGKVEASLPLDDKQPSPYSDLPTQFLLSALPSLLHEKDALDIFIIGYGSGATTSTSQRIPWIRSIAACDLEKSVFHASSLFTKSLDASLPPLPSMTSQALRLLSRDARAILNHEKHQYDIIIAQPAEPWVAGAADLYTREFYTLARKRLNDDGIYCQWIQLYAIGQNELEKIINTFHSIFPYSLVYHPKNAGEILIIGRSSQKPIDIEKLSQRFEIGTIQRIMLRAGIKEKYDLLAGIVLYPEELDSWTTSRIDAGLITDDDLSLEFALPRKSFNSVSIAPRLKSLSGASRNEAAKAAYKKLTAVQSCRLALAYTIRSLTEHRLETDSFLDYLLLPVKDADHSQNTNSSPEKIQAIKWLSQSRQYESKCMSAHLYRKIAETLLEVNTEKKQENELGFSNKEKDDSLSVVRLLASGVHDRTINASENERSCNSRSYYEELGYLLTNPIDWLDLLSDSFVEKNASGWSLQALANWLSISSRPEKINRTKKELQATLKLDPNQYYPRLALGCIESMNIDSTNSLRYLKSASILAPEKLRPRALITLLLLRNGKLELVERNLEIQQRLFPEAIINKRIRKLLDSRAKSNEIDQLIECYSRPELYIHDLEN